MTTATVTATDAARALIDELRDEHGPLAMHVSGSYGVSVVCLKVNELNLGTRDVLMGRVGDVPLFLMTSEVDYWRGSTMVLDVASGVAAGFSMEGPTGRHFTLRKRADPNKRTWDADAILAAGPPPSNPSGSLADD